MTVSSTQQGDVSRLRIRTHSRHSEKTVPDLIHGLDDRNATAMSLWKLLQTTYRIKIAAWENIGLMSDPSASVYVGASLYESRLS